MSAPTFILFTFGDRDPFGVVVRFAVSEVFADFAAYDVIATTGEGVRLFERKGQSSPTDNMIEGMPTDDALVFVQGSVKWDGCSNFTFPAQEECMLHTCDRAKLLRVGELLAAIYDHAATLLPGWYVEDEQPSIGVALNADGSRA